MWISKRDYEELNERLNELEKKVGVRPKRSMYDFSLLALVYGHRKPGQPLSLTDKIEQIMEHLGLEEQHTHEAYQIVAKPKAKQRKSNSPSKRKYVRSGKYAKKAA